ncbi:phage tail tape measure protein [Haemophilus sputorum]|uniref:Phage tail tape measure protein n=1 Tax=Haemophilus sputorum TaxID=1078480 RepID=A0A369YD79_9PAST|nr:phage tail tape measure protein [Haemophilus sputorum]RDE72671.1 phage tail tape measure protein [Haemophilus sputorum]
MADLELSLKIKAQDQASAAVQAVANKTKRANQEIKDSTKQSENEQQQAKKKTAQVSQELAAKAEMHAKRVAQAKKTLEIKTERDLQFELRKTQQAYQTLAKSGTASARDLAKARESVIRKERELRAEMGKQPLGQRMANVGRGVVGVGAGVMAGAMVMREPVKKAMSYDRELAMVANTAFSDRDAEGRIAGKKQLHEAVKAAVETGGGTKEEALSSLNALLASGIKAETAISLLPTLQKGATATGASPEDLAAITISALQNGIKEADIGKALDMAIAAGQAGQFELQDMARWLPQQMAAASQMGLKGLDGFEALLIANQQARVTAGTNDEAGNNLVNLLSKITSKETVERLEKYEYTDKKGKKRSINYLKSMEAYKSQGKNSLEAFTSIMDDVIGSDEGYKKLQARLKNAKKEEQAKILNEMTTMAEGTAIGQIISDRQALMALLAIRNNVQLGQEVKDSVAKSDGATETSYKVIADTNDFKTEKAKAQFEFGQMEGLSGFNNALGSTAETLSEYMSKYPDLTAAVASAGTGIAALGAAALSAAGAISLLGRKNGGGFGDFDIGDFGGKNNGGSKAGGKGFGLGWLAKAGLVAELALHSNELNAGEDEMIAARFEKMQASGNMYVSQQSQQAVNSAPPFAMGIAQMASQIGAVTAQQSAMQGEVSSVNHVLSQYQADFNAFGQKISDGIQAGLAAQSHTIDNRITVELDGAVIAENVSQRQFQFFKRG